MRVLKVVAEGTVTSFRYPHFVQGVHLSFEMPPPATIYGHICSAVGDYIPLDTTQFAYHFQFDAKFFDYEHLHFFGKDPKMNPFKREQLYNPRLTLYLTNVDLGDYFLRPRYPVALGRVQDLMTYTEIREVEVEQVDKTFYEDTLLPLSLAAQIGGRSYAVTMPRYINENRVPTWGQYAILRDRIIYPGADSLITDPDFPIWVDTTVQHPSENLQRGLVWHTWG